MGFRVAFSGEWVDLLGSVEDAQGTSALTREIYGDATNNSGYLMRFFRHDQDDEMQLAFQFNHDVKVPGDAKFHVHVIPMSLPVLGVSDVVRWTYRYVLAAPGTNVPRTGWTTSTISHTIAVADQYLHKVHGIVTVPIPAGTAASALLFVRIIRPGNSDAADTYSVNKGTSGGGLTAAANLAVVGIDVHVQRSRAGTRGEFA